MKINNFIKYASITAIAVSLGAGSAMAQEAPADDNGMDIIVTAGKREENIRQIAMPISAVTGDQLAKANANSLSDYIVRLPGVVFNDYQPGISEVVIRGVAATTYHEQGQTTVGYYLNEVPVVEPGFPIGIPDIDAFDLDRVEVLRGPQGTLFGSSTLGGLVNYVVKTADPTKFDAAASGTIGTIKNAGDDVNYAAKLMVNVPIIQDKLAVRVMGLQRFDAGYLDNTGTGVDSANDFRTRGLRGSIVFTPTEATKITYMSTYQDSKLDDQTYLSVADELVRSTPRAEPQKTSFWLNSLRLEQNLDFATFTAIGSVNKKTNTTIFSYPYGYVTGVFTGPDAAYGPGRATANIKTIEGRLASNGDGPIRWLIGSSYLRATKHSYDQIIAPGAEAFINANPADFGGVSGSILAPGDRIYGYETDSLNEDFGIFGEVTWKLVEGLEITGGGRYYHTRAKADVLNQAGFVSGNLVDSSGTLDQKESGFTPKVTVTLRPTSNVMAYFTYSEGYRVGGINPNAGLLAAIPANYDSDKVQNYEAGVKITTADRRLAVDLTAFSLDWKNIQARQFGPAPSFFSYVVNSANANIMGVEFAGSVQVIPRALTFNSNVTYQEANLTKFLPDNYGPGYPAGTPLPGSSKWSVANNLLLDLQDVPGQPSVEVAHRYISKAPVAFGNDFQRGGFSIFDARVGYTVYENFRLTAFVNNIANKYGILSGPFANQFTPAYSITRPRNMGLRADWSL